MITFKTPTDKECFIDPNEVIGVVPCTWGLFQGSAILLNGGVSVAVCGEPGEVMEKLGKGLKQVGWYDPAIQRVCTSLFKEKFFCSAKNYTRPVYIKEE